jgi:hypothetical protein
LAETQIKDDKIKFDSAVEKNLEIPDVGTDTGILTQLQKNLANPLPQVPRIDVMDPV